MSPATDPIPDARSGPAPAPIRFVVLASQRTGSSWLVDLLNRQPGWRTCTEVYLDRPRSPDRGTPFWDNLMPGQRYYEFRAERKLSRPFAGWRYLRFLESQESVGYDAFGFKLMYSQLRHLPELALYLCLRRYRVIHLVRDNPLDVVISRCAMKRQRQVHRAKDAAAAPSPSGSAVFLPPVQALRDVRWALRKRRAMNAALALMPTPVMRVTYEQLQADPRGTIAAILGWVGRPTERVVSDSAFARVSPSGQRDKVSNYTDVRDAFQRAGLGRYLDGDD